MQSLVHIVLGSATGRRGGVAMVGALSLVGLLGTAGLAVDLGAAYVQRAHLQKVADSAALAGGLSWIKSSHSSDAAIATIQSVVTANGLPASAIQNPSQAYLAQSPKNASNPAIQVSLSSSSPLSLMQVVVSATSVTTGAYAVAEMASSGTAQMPACVVALTTLTINSNSGITAKNCSVAADGSNSSQTILLNSNASIITADNVITPGGINVNSNATIQANTIFTGYGVTKKSNTTVTGTVVTQGVSGVPDPYSSYQSIASNGFVSCQNYNNQSTLTPGCWQNVNVNSNSSLSLQPGTYYFQSFNLNSNTSLTGSGVTLVFQQQFSPGSNTTITLTAPSATSGQPMPGMAMYTMGGLNINSNVAYNVNGGIYSPTQPVVMNSNTFNSTACTYLVAQSITFNSNAALDETNCSSSPGYPLPTGPGIGGTASTVALVK